MNIKRLLKETKKKLAKKSIAFSAVIMSLAFVGFSASNIVVLAVSLPLALALFSVFWLGAKHAWIPKVIRPGHTYIFCDFPGNPVNKDRLFLNELRIRYKTSGYFEEPDTKSNRYREGVFKVDIIIDPLIHGEEYIGAIEEFDGQFVLTLQRAKKK